MSYLQKTDKIMLFKENHSNSYNKVTSLRKNCTVENYIHTRNLKCIIKEVIRYNIVSFIYLIHVDDKIIVCPLTVCDIINVYKF